MAISNGYATLAEVKERLFTDETVTSDDSMIESMVEAISRVIDSICHTRFWATSETRYYTAKNGREVRVDDLLSVTTLATDGDGDLDYDETWATTDYLLMPRNAPRNDEPYTYIRQHPNGTKYFPTLEDGVKITGVFGYSTGDAPTPINEACLLAVEQLHKRKDAIFGVMSPEGFMHRIRTALLEDPHIRTLLTPYARIF